MARTVASLFHSEKDSGLAHLLKATPILNFLFKYPHRYKYIYKCSIDEPDDIGFFLQQS
jgi:hypothetical protein